MKKFLLAALVIASFSQSSRADLIERSYYYYHIPSQDMIQPYNFNEDTKTAVYYDYRDSKKKTVNIADLSKETKASINGVKQGSVVLLNKEGHKFCETFHVFENGIAYIGCQVQGMQDNLGLPRPNQLNYFAPTEILIGEVKSADGFKKKDKVTLLRDAGKISAGSKVRIEAILANGEALIQKIGVGFLDTSSLRLKSNIQRVYLTDLEKNSDK